VPTFVLQYVYQLTDFSATGGNVIPPAEQGADAAGTPPYNITLNSAATPIPLTLDDNDSNLNEIGDTGQLLSAPITLGGVTYPVGTPLIVNYVITTANGFQGYSITLGQVNSGNNTTTAFVTSDPMVPGQQYTFTTEANIANANVPYSNLACFAAGTLIEVPDGQKRVEDLVVGDLVLTRDRGAQPIRWVGKRMVAGIGPMAPIVIEAGTLGVTEDLFVSPHHRLLVESQAVELHFAEDGLLVAAKHLVNGRNILRKTQGFITYVHIMFDHHEIVVANGCAAESFFVGNTLDGVLHPEQLQELQVLFPALQPSADSGPARMARPVANGHEGRLIASSI
jgi:hypothetical protein